MIFGLFRKKPKVLTVHPVRKKIKKTSKAKPKKVKVKKTMPQTIGEVTHYFPHVKAAVVLITKGSVALGDTLQFKGHTTDFKQKIKSMQIDNVPIKEAKKGQEIGLLVKARARHGDVVYKV